MRRRLLAALTAATLLVAGCTSSSSHPARSEHASATSSSSTGAVSSVIVSGVARRPTISEVGPGIPPGPLAHFASLVYSIGPSGPLTAAATVTVPLTRGLPAGTPVVAVTRESDAAPLTYLPASLSGNGDQATFTTTHFSQFGILWLDTKELADAFKSDFLDGVTGGLSQTIERPSCANETQARGDGYTITSSNTDAVYWCFGVENGSRVLKVTVHRRYPMEIRHPNMDVLSNPYDHSALAALSRSISGQTTIVEPGGTATYNADLSAGGSEGISTTLDGLGQTLYALQTGVETLLEILSRFGAGAGRQVTDLVDKAVSVPGCAHGVAAAAGSGDVGSLIHGCFDAATVLDTFGTAGLLLAPVMAVGSVIAFFQSEWNALVDQFNQHDKYVIDIRRSGPSFAMIAGTYYGHTRGLTITSDGLAKESIGDGCCDPVIDVAYRLSNLTGSPTVWTATATTTQVDVHPGWQYAHKPDPLPGQTYTLSARNGVVVSSLSGTNYCTMKADLTGVCGA